MSRRGSAGGRWRGPGLVARSFELWVRVPVGAPRQRLSKNNESKSKNKQLGPEYIMRNTGLDEAQAGIKIAGRNINNLRYTDDTTLMVEGEEPLDERERGE